MTAVARLFAFTLLLVTLGSSSACLTTICLNALCGASQQVRGTSADLPALAPVSRQAPPTERALRADHDCASMRF